MERRMTNVSANVEQRNDDPPVISGTASVFYREGDVDTEYELWPGGPVERIMPGAFSRALEENDDVVGLFNHDNNIVLGRTPNTLKLRQDDEGLKYRIETDPNNPQHRSVVSSIRRGDVRGSSFAFAVEKEEWRKDGDKEVREVHAVRLADVSPVTRPAYSGTDTSVRADEYRSAQESYQQWQSKLESNKRIEKAKGLQD